MDYRLRHLSFLDIEILAELSEHQSLRALARSLKLEPPRLTKNLQKIKSEIHVDILKTSSHGYVLTSEGAYISEQAKEILTKSENLIPNKKIKSTLIQTYTVGSRGFLNLICTAPLIKTLQHNQNLSHLRFLDLSPAELRTTAFDGVLDIAIHLEEIAWPQTWACQQIGQLNWSFFVHKNHPLSEQTTTEQLLKFPWTQSAHWNGQRLAHSSDQLAIPKQDRQIGHEMQTALNALEIIKTTDHVTLTPDLIVKKYDYENQFKKIDVLDLKTPKAPVFLSVRSDKIQQKIFNHWVKNLKEIFDTSST